MSDTAVSIIRLISYWQIEVLFTLVRMKLSHQQTSLQFCPHRDRVPTHSGQIELIDPIDPPPQKKRKDLCLETARRKYVNFPEV